MRIHNTGLKKYLALLSLQIIAVTASIYNQLTEEESDGVVTGLGLELVDLSAQVQFKLVELAATGVRRHLSHIDDLGLARLVRQPRNKSRNNIWNVSVGRFCCMFKHAWNSMLITARSELYSGDLPLFEISSLMTDCNARHPRLAGASASTASY